MIDMGLLTPEELERKIKQAEIALSELNLEKKKLALENWEAAIETGQLIYKEIRKKRKIDLEN